MDNNVLERYISDLRIRVENLLKPPTNKERLGRASGYQHCAEELQSLIDTNSRKQQP